MISATMPPPAPYRPNVPDADGKVDLATAERMVAEAVVRASAAEDKTAAIVAARVQQAGRRAARQNLLLKIGLFVTLLAMLGVAAHMWESHRVASALADDVGIDKGPGKRPSGDIPSRVYSGREIYENNRAALYLVGFLAGNKVGGVCTGFAIEPDLIATNAHCIAAYKGKGKPIVTQNDSGGRVRFHILSGQMHPRYQGGHASADSPDVGLIRIEGRVPKTVTLANDAELHSIGPGDDAFVLGFPGRLMDPLSPSATFLQGHVGRLMGLGEQAPRSLDDAVLIQHDAVTRGGNSGSPLFNQYGHVIGIHSAHLDDEDEVQVDGQKTTVVKSSPFRVAMRVDLLRGVRAP
jgi:S1-C subfamily serine protease